MTRLVLSLLGPFQVKLDGRPVTEFESNKVRALLAYLAAESDRPHSRDELMALLWPDQPDVQARNNLRHALSNLRQVIGDAEAQPSFLSVTRDCIQFNTDSDHWLDVAELDALVSACGRHTHRHVETCQSCVQRLRQAVEQYHGDFLGQFFLNDSPAFEEWAVLERERLRQQSLDALHRIATYLDRSGDYEQALRYARRQLELDPWREVAHRQAMRALALSGQCSAALAQYETCRRALAEELGVEPARETTALFEQIKSGSLIAAHGISQAGFSNLPSPTTPFVGRQMELAEIATMLENPACRLVTLVGPGGIGKTRLALVAAAEQVGAFTHGVYWVSLAPLNSTDYIVPAIAQAIGFTFSKSQDPKAQLLSYLREKEMLLVLNNFEHLLGGASLLTEILQHAPGLALVVTSRERLNLQGEWVFDTQGLNFPEDETTLVARMDRYSALELFVQSARRIEASFLLSEKDISCVVHLCRLVAGMPLAIELAAGWMRTLSCDEITLHIEQGLGILTSSLRDVPERHRSMRAVFDHSWNLLSEEERSVFCKLSIFRGGFTRQAAEQVAGASLPSLAALMDKSLVSRASRCGDDGRYDLHELLRQYAYEKLVESGEAEQIQARHLAYFVALAEETEPKLRTAERLVCFRQLKIELDNLRVALEWSWAGAKALQAQNGLRLANALEDLWHESGRAVAEGLGWLKQGLTLVDSEDPTSRLIRAKALMLAGDLARYQGAVDSAHMMLQESLALYRAANPRDKRGLAYALTVMAHELIVDNYDLPGARALIEESLAMCRTFGPSGRWNLAYTLYWDGIVAFRQQDYESARLRAQESSALFRQVGDIPMTAAAIMIPGWIAYLEDDAATARAHYENALTVYQETGYEEAGFKESVISIIADLADIDRQMGDYATASARYEQVLTYSREGGDRLSIAKALRPLASVVCQQGDHEQAAGLLRESLSLLQETQRTDFVALSLVTFSDVLRAQGQPLGAARLLGAVASRFESLWVPERAEYAQSIAATRAVLGEAAFAAALEEGRAVTIEQAIAYALETY